MPASFYARSKFDVAICIEFGTDRSGFILAASVRECERLSRSPQPFVYHGGARIYDRFQREGAVLEGVAPSLNASAPSDASPVNHGRSMGFPAGIEPAPHRLTPRQKPVNGEAAAAGPLRKIFEIFLRFSRAGRAGGDQRRRFSSVSASWTWTNSTAIPSSRWRTTRPAVEPIWTRVPIAGLTSLESAAPDSDRSMMRPL